MLAFSEGPSISTMPSTNLQNQVSLTIWYVESFNTGHNDWVYFTFHFLLTRNRSEKFSSSKPPFYFIRQATWYDLGLKSHDAIWHMMMTLLTIFVRLVWVLGIWINCAPDELKNACGSRRALVHGRGRGLLTMGIRASGYTWGPR